MIQSNELRYGNKLLFLGNIETFEFIDQIREDGVFWIQTKEQKIAYKNFQFKPVELTEDILLKCGFQNNEPNYFWITIKGYENDETYIYINKISSGIGIFQNDKENYLDIEIKYLHQLQNLYFALTNQELTINL